MKWEEFKYLLENPKQESSTAERFRHFDMQNKF